MEVSTIENWKEALAIILGILAVIIAIWIYLLLINQAGRRHPWEK